MQNNNILCWLHISHVTEKHYKFVCNLPVQQILSITYVGANLMYIGN